MKVLLVNHLQERCGVYQHGWRMAQALLSDDRYESEYLETNDQQEFLNKVAQFNPDVIMYNWHTATLPWFTPQLSYQINAKQLLFHHENELPYHLNSNAILMADMTENPIAKIYGLPRTLPKGGWVDTESNEIITIGSFGFGFDNKGFEKVCSKVSEEYDEAVINLHITSAFFGDAAGVMASGISERCRAAINKSGIKLNITNHFVSDNELIQFLNKNDINLFLYNYEENRGLSSAIDYAVAAGKPFGVSNSTMFRHVLEIFPQVNANINSIKSILEFGNAPATYFEAEWSDEKLKNKFYYILEEVKK